MDVEQTQEQTTEQTQTSDDATRDELIEAVREAGGTESVDVAAEEKQAQTAATEQAKPEPAAEEDPEKKFEAILAKRRSEHEKVSRADRILREAEETKQRLIEEARAEARRIAEAELERERAKFRSSPKEALRALGNVDEVTEAVDEVLREGTPEARALAKAREDARQAHADAQIGKKAKEELDRFRKELAAERRAEVQARVRSEYLSQFASPEKTPHLHARWEPEEIFQRSVALAHQWAQEGLEYKKDFDDSTIAEYLELQSKKRIAALHGSTPANQVPAGAPEKGQVLATKVTANAPRTLSAAAGSERRTSPRPFHEMKPEEQRQALLDEVAAARRANPDASS